MSRTIRRKGVGKPVFGIVKDYHFYGDWGRSWCPEGTAVKRECRRMNRIKTRHFIREVMKAKDPEDVNNTIPRYQRCGDIWNWD